MEESIRIALGSVERSGSQMNSGLSIILVLRGEVTLKTPGQNRNLTQSHYAVINHNDVYILDSSGPNVFLWVTMEQPWLEFACPGYAHSRYYCCSTVSNPATQPLFEVIRQRVVRAAMLRYQREEGYALLMQAELLQLLHTLSLHFCSDAQQSSLTGTSERLKPVLEYMDRNFREPMTLESVSAKFYLSDAHLARLFRRELNMTFMEYLTALRLESARQGLLYTRDSITRLALNNGFSSVKSFNQYFRRSFDCSPAQYRRQMVHRPEPAKAFWLEAGAEDSLELLARFVESYEHQPQGADAQFQVDLPGQPAPLGLPPLILDVGELNSALRENVRRQIREAQRRIGFTNVLISGPFRERKAGLLRRYDEMELLAELVGMKLTPMIVVDTSTEVDDLDDMLELLVSQFGRQELESWRYALDGRLAGTGEDFAQVAGLLRKYLPGGKVGLCVDLDLPPQWMDTGLEEGKLAQFTDFIIVSSDPNHISLAGDAFSYERFQKRYHQNQMNRVHGWMEEHRCPAPVYLVGWNTLTGRSLVESGKFHRTALILDTLLMLRRDVAGYGIRLNLGCGEGEKPELLTYPLSLYLYQDIKRPLFFVAQWLRGVGELVVREEPGLLVTQSREEEYQALIWHPCYIDPFFSLEDLQEDRYSRRVCLTLRGLSPGTYRVKRLYLDKDHGSIYSNWVKIDMAAQLDQDILDHLSRACNPSVALEYRQVEDELELVQTLSMNGAALWSVRKVDM